jgi:hypothetical protein
MSTPITADQLLTQLKKWKVPYREIDGWRTRGRDSFTGLTFGPVFGCVTHHTGDDAPDTADQKVIINGRPELAGPLAQFGLNDDGVVDLISVHRCNHAGGGDPRVLEAVKAESYGDYPPAPHEHQGSPGAVDGNDCFYGCETYYSGGKAPTAAAYKTLVLLWAALCDFHGWSAKSVIGHKEWSDWKSDPGHVDMKVLRADVQKALDAAHAPKPTLLPIRHRIVTSNLYVHNPAKGSLVDGPLAGVNRIIALTKAAFRYVPDVIACQESQRALDELAKVEGTQLLVDRDHGEAGLELAVLLRDKLQPLGTEFHPAADGTGTGVFDHPRGIFVLKYTKRGRKTAVVNTHMGLIPKRDVDHTGPAALQHAAHAQKVLATVQRLERNGFTVFVTADANSTGAWPQSLPAVLAAAGMTVTLNRIDLVASNPKKVKAPQVQQVLIVNKSEVGSDTHDAVAISATERRAS